MGTYILLWLPMLLIAVVNGFLREAVFKKYMNEVTAHQLSTLSLLVFFAFYIRFVMVRFPPASSKQALFIGVLWMLMTLLFEFGFGRWRGHSWAELLKDYNLLQGHIWVLVPLFLCIAPFIFFTPNEHTTINMDSKP